MFKSNSLAAELRAAGLWPGKGVRYLNRAASGRERHGIGEPALGAVAGDPLPCGPSVFLAGPTPRSSDVPSWRPAPTRELAAQWQGPGKLAVLIPEPPDGQRFAYYDDQVQWETDARGTASVILFWMSSSWA